MTKIIFPLILLIAFSYGNSQDESSLSKSIIGKWKMVKVLEISEDVTEKHNPDNSRWIIFKEDSSFESGSAEKKENTGRWNINETKKELYLDSDAGEDDDSYWEVSFNNNLMDWKGRRFEFNKRFEIVHEKVEKNVLMKESKK